MINRYLDKVSGETLYVRETIKSTQYFKDPKCTILHRIDGGAKVINTVVTIYNYYIDGICIPQYNEFVYKSRKYVNDLTKP